ncbi:MAG: glycosyltransferase [Candidatus Hodarchaeota archaeon]
MRGIQRVLGRHKVLHIEAGSSFGGSTVGLENYLRATTEGSLIHDVIFFHNLPDIERIKGYCHCLFILNTSDGTYQKENSNSVCFYHLKSMIIATSIFSNKFFYKMYCFLREFFYIIKKEIPRAIKLMRIIKRGNYDLIHSNNTISIQISSVIASKILRIPIVSHIRTRTELSFIQRIFAKRVNCFISVTNSLREDFIRQGISRDIFVCYEGIEIRKLNQIRVNQMDTDGVLGCTVGSVGRLVERKGFKYLIEAAKLVLDEYPEARFVIVGDGEERQELEKLSEDLGIRMYIDFKGHRNDIREILQTFAVFVLPSLREGLPLVLVEAMAEGKPILATSVDGVPEFIQNGKTGLLVQPRNSQEIAIGILRLLRNRDLAQRLGNNARRFVIKHGDMIKTTKMIDEVFSHLLRK